MLPQTAVDEDSQEQPVIKVTKGPNTGFDLTSIKEKNGYLFVRKALRQLFTRQELIEGMLLPKKENKDRSEDEIIAGTSASTPMRPDLSPTRKQTLKGILRNKNLVERVTKKKN